MTAPRGCGENRGTLCVSPQKGTAGAAGATNAGCAAATRRALAPICRFHQEVALRSLHGLRSAVPVSARQKSFFGGARRIGCEPAVHWQARPNAPFPTKGTLDRSGDAEWQRREALG